MLLKAILILALMPLAMGASLIPGDPVIWHVSTQDFETDGLYRLMYDLADEGIVLGANDSYEMAILHCEKPMLLSNGTILERCAPSGKFCDSCHCPINEWVNDTGERYCFKCWGFRSSPILEGRIEVNQTLLSEMKKKGPYLHIGSLDLDIPLPYGLDGLVKAILF